MKKFIFTIVALILGVFEMNAQKIYFDDVVEVPLDGAAKVSVKYETGGLRLTSYSFRFDLSEAEGLSIAQKDGGVDFVTDSKNSAFNITATDAGVGGTAKNNTVSLDGTEGALGTFTLMAASPLKVGDEVTVKVDRLSLVEYTDDERLVSMPLDDLTFTVKIVENIVTLDENSENVPEAAENVKVKVLRTIKANQWSTLCLPFDMTAEQVKAAFGDDVKLAYFDVQNQSSVTVEKDGTDIVGITVTFANDDLSDGFFGNFPYVIQTSKDITDFTVDEVSIDPDADNAKASYSTGSKKTELKNYGFYGTLKAGTTIPENGLFINGNKFWYSKGTTVIKGFRGYFKFDDVLTNNSASSKIVFNVDGEATSIDGIGVQRIVEGVYDLSGRKIKVENNDLNTLQKGVYIIDGKKVTIK